MLRRCRQPRPPDGGCNLRDAAAERDLAMLAHGGDLSLRTAMKEGLLGGTLCVSSKSESKEARLHVARWAGSESSQDRCLPDLGRRDRRRVGLAAGRRRAARARCEGGDAGSDGARGDRVDERGAVRARPPRRARLGCVDRRRDEGQGVGAVGVQDRPHRRQSVGDVVGARPGPGDLAARPAGAPRARARHPQPTPGP
jgi:hypothetical protein